MRGSTRDIIVPAFLYPAVVTSIIWDQTARRLNLMTASTRRYIVGSFAHVNVVCSRWLSSF